MSEQDATPDDRPSDDGAPEVRAEAPETRAEDTDVTAGRGRTRDVRASAARLLREHPRTALVTAGVLAFALLGGGAVAAGAATAPDAPVASSALSGADGDGSAGPADVVTVTPDPTEAPDPQRVAPAVVPPATKLRTCSVAAAASDPRLAQFEGSVVNATTGEVLFDRNGSTPARTGSVLKTLTSAVALAVLGGDHRLTTTVTGDPGSGTIALVGGGDATLSATGRSVYSGAPTLSDLAGQVAASLGGQPVSQITLDATWWSQADKWDPSWKRTEQTIGYHSEVTALMVDGDRADPSAVTSPRSTDPVGRAGEAFRSALVAAGVSGAASASISQGTASSATVLGSVQSQPVSTLIGQMLPNSDNTLAEMLARASSRESGADGSAASLTALYRSALSGTYGLDASVVTIVDGSGLSEDNAVPSTFVARLMIQVRDRAHGLGAVYDALPISGQTGTLASRFTGSNAAARGAVHAKTGWIDTAYTLAGSIDSADGTPLTFAFYAIGPVQDNARSALDTLTASVWRCGNSLANS
ncbi:D-alanyl-D-alanine carboxypeptidase/D-alanyl-D-alanine-endopeptidase (penicillin-binding protein 4) [Frigoribacterium sp. PhB107]|uniref:D-alanyl-D-alanine carboxypeptidase/D-alanyl-D-alanine endopeptidase n=1 Tax=Frigoribacterium sp. PhB107 TaxID=2485172 RepID=UPI000F49AD86|nr:D-alanyl-D-alanine carboxypeptidase/D-alanyl-D-alanine-endopeptidase [Frigoribacterium sp. PhB107]ROP78285.1 D-alanyl-D-alanine carboxypeptidase/D-alanyl-D-alanine-endopeptidase (penicillin-binding protein 4) [Frigoribacterium sp. PhB107]